MKWNIGEFIDDKYIEYKCIHLCLFMHTIQNNTILSVPKSPIEGQASSLFMYKALYIDGTPDH